ncbi:MAG: hypothetical protein ACFFCS_23445 [Candidatus Hodarchaeota archaeon]
MLKTKLLAHMDSIGDRWQGVSPRILPAGIWKSDRQIFFAGDLEATPDGHLILHTRPAGFPVAVKIPVPFSELLEDYLDRPLYLEFMLSTIQEKYRGKLEIDSNEKMHFRPADGNITPLIELFGDETKGSLTITSIIPAKSQEHEKIVDHHLIFMR